MQDDLGQDNINAPTSLSFPAFDNKIRPDDYALYLWVTDTSSDKTIETALRGSSNSIRFKVLCPDYLSGSSPVSEITIDKDFSSKKFYARYSGRYRSYSLDIGLAKIITKDSVGNTVENTHIKPDWDI